MRRDGSYDSLLRLKKRGSDHLSKAENLPLDLSHLFVLLAFGSQAC